MFCLRVHHHPILLRSLLANQPRSPGPTSSRPRTGLVSPVPPWTLLKQIRQKSSEGKGKEGGKEGGKERKDCPSQKVSPLELEVKAADTIKPECTEKGDSDKLDPEWLQPRVVIVGAGIAGLSAAEQLYKYGFKCVTILEAKERPGGRIWTCNLDKSVVEMGAQKIVGGTIANSMVPLVARDAVSAGNVRKQSVHDHPMIFLTECGSILRMNIVNKVKTIFDEMIERAKNIYRKASQEDYSSLKDFFDNFLDSEIPANFKLLERTDAIKVINALILDLENEWGTEVTNISANFFGSRLDMPGYVMTFDKGFANILKPMLKKLPSCCLALEKPVKYIKWDLPVGYPRAMIRCCDEEEIPADYVIVTVSLGVLKSQGQTLFCPNLPEEKYEIIDRIGYGHINKIFLQYEKPFWVNREAHIKPAISCDEADWLESVGCIEETPVPNSNVLVATLGGVAAKEVECVSDCEVVSRLQRLIRCAVGDVTLPYPKMMSRSSWSKDPHYCGATTYMSADSNIGDIMKLSDPVPMSAPNGAPVLFFAGEATSPCHYGTVHGARQAGIREADRIIHLTKLFCGLPPRLDLQECSV